MAYNITSANASLRIIVPAIYPGGFTVEDYAADDMFETASMDNAEDMMSADGKYHAGFVFNTVNLTINIMANSSTGDRLDNWWSTERTTLTKFDCNAVLSIPALQTKFNFVNGVLFTWNPIPPAKRILQPRQAIFHFETVTRGAI